MNSYFAGVCVNQTCQVPAQRPTQRFQKHEQHWRIVQVCKHDEVQKACKIAVLTRQRSTAKLDPNVKPAKSWPCWGRCCFLGRCWLPARAQGTLSKYAHRRHHIDLRRTPVSKRKRIRRQVKEGLYLLWFKGLGKGAIPPWNLQRMQRKQCGENCESIKAAQ